MFVINMLDDETGLDAIPVVKTTHYPWTEGSFRPLAYARLAYVQGRGLLLDAQAFERDPDVSSAQLQDNSCAALALQLSPKAPLFVVVLCADGRYEVYWDGQPLPLTLAVSTYGGSDEQGWYWGVRFYLTPDMLREIFAVSVWCGGHTIKGTFYKFKRAGSDSHMGAVMPMHDFSIFSYDNLGDFQVAGY